MAFAKGDVHFAEYVWDFAVDGGAVSTIDLSAKDGYEALPEGALVYDVYAVVETEVDSAGDGASVSIGTASDVDGFYAATGEASLGANAVLRAGETAAALLWDDANDHLILYRPGSTANNQKVVVAISGEAATAGKIRVIVCFYHPRENP